MKRGSQIDRAATSLSEQYRAHRAGRAACFLGSIALASILAACQTTPPPPNIIEPAARVEIVSEPGWRSEALPEDAARIDGLAEAWEEALVRARDRGFTRQIDAEGRLLDPQAGLPWPAPTPGNYMCRWLRFGSGEEGRRAYTSYRDFFCYVGGDGESLSITKQTGSDRPAGYLLDDEDKDRMIFLGSLALGDEEPRAYGEDPSRDLAGIFERIGSLHFRLVIPRSRPGFTLEVIELVPAPVQRD